MCAGGKLHITMKNKQLVVLLGLCLTFGAVSSAQFTLNPIPAKIFGQFASPRTVQELVVPNTVAPNLVEGREFYNPMGVAVDSSAGSPILYVADTGNNRILAWKNAAGFQNGAPADLVLGQKDFYSTVPQGPGTSFTSGLYSPTSIAVDAKGNVFVMDAGNNRILRYPAPFAETKSQPILADLVIGQDGLNHREANRRYNTSNPETVTAISLKTNGTNTGGIQVATIRFDQSGNLWLSDSGNHRLLRYPAADVSGASNTGAGGSAIGANLVLGQPDFSTAKANPGRYNVSSDRIDKRSIRFGGPIAFDASGNLFFADDLSRVLVWKAESIYSAAPADRILGIYVQAPDQPAPVVPNEVMFGVSVSGATLNYGPQGLFCIGDYLFVSDTLLNRIVRYDPLSTWPAEDLLSYTYSPKMTAIYGQLDFHSSQANGGTGLEPSNSSVYAPIGAAPWAGGVFLADSLNHRVLSLTYNADEHILAPADRVLGQYDFAFNAPNLIEGREMSTGTLPLLLSNGQVTGLTVGPATFIDRTSNPPHLYIADTGNNRILGFADARRFKYGDTADLVIGQVSLTRNLYNSPTNDPGTPTATGLSLPASIVTDSNGDLWVADTGNGRILRFPRPFDHLGENQAADLVLGQPDFQTKATGEVTRSSLYRPSSLALTMDGNIVVADLAQSRVLLFTAPFYSGAPATLVLGQADDVSAGAGTSEAQMNLPLGVSIDTDDRLYVSDTGNNRILIFGRINAQADGAAAALVLPVSAQGVTPISVTVSAATGQIWVADLRGNRVLRYPRFDQLFFNPGQSADFGFNTYAPRHIALDEQDYILVSDSSHRITMHFPMLAVANAATSFPRVAPGMLGILQATGVRLSSESAQAGPAPLPNELGDVRLLVDGMAAPLMKIDGDILRFIVPKDAPTSGTSDFTILRASTGQILAQSRVAMALASPAVLYQGANPSSEGQARAINQDGSQNTSGRPAASNQELTVYLTGQGSVPGMPEDGVAPGSEVPVPDVRAFILAGASAAEAQVISSTLDTAEPGVWKVKVKLPQVPLNGTYGFAVIYRTSFSSNSYTSGSTVLRVNPLISINK